MVSRSHLIIPWWHGDLPKGRPPRIGKWPVIVRFTRDWVVHCRNGAQISDDCPDIVVAKFAVEPRGHCRTDYAAVGSLSFPDCEDNLVVCPGTNTRFWIGCDVGNHSCEILMFDHIAAAEFLVRQRTIRPLWCVAICACSNCLNEIATPLG